VSVVVRAGEFQSLWVLNFWYTCGWEGEEGSTVRQRAGNVV
jgi:hypothetical protein